MKEQIFEVQRRQRANIHRVIDFKYWLVGAMQILPIMSAAETMWQKGTDNSKDTTAIVNTFALEKQALAASRQFCDTLKGSPNQQEYLDCESNAGAKLKLMQSWRRNIAQQNFEVRKQDCETLMSMEGRSAWENCMRTAEIDLRTAVDADELP